MCLFGFLNDLVGFLSAYKNFSNVAAPSPTFCPIKSEALLTQLLEDPELLFPETDKGLGPCAVTYDQYVEDCLVHLLNEECYRRLSKEEALAAVAALETDIEDWFAATKVSLDETLLILLPNTWTTMWRALLGNSMFSTKSTRRRKMANGQPVLSVPTLVASRTASENG